MPTLTIADQTIYYTHSNPSALVVQRPPLVLVHGAGGDHLHWPPQLRRLAGCEVYALDLPGHGHSPGAGRNTITAYAQVLNAFADTLALPPFVLAGHSMGGAIAFADPDRRMSFSYSPNRMASIADTGPCATALIDATYVSIGL